jgi:NADH:ubiquinone oxidoreductase subunit 6 (subunit J)
MSVATIMLYFFTVTLVVSAVGLIWVKHVFYAALLVITILLSIAGLYILMFAEFIAVAQIIVYAGGILVLIIFGIMLTSRIGSTPLVMQHTRVVPGILVGVTFFVGMAYAFLQQPYGSSSSEISSLVNQPIQHIGFAIMTDYVFVFELAGILLLIALVGSAVVASKPKSESE